MIGKCSNPNCAAPISCHEGLDNHEKCEFWKANNPKEEGKEIKNSKVIKNNDDVPWNGEAFKIEELNKITIRNKPITIGIVGKVDAGKTTYLAMLFTLLLRGEKFQNYSFAGTKTILGWDRLYHKLQIQKNNVAFPDPTAVHYIRLLHIALRNNEDILKDILLADASGEVFSWWSQNKEDDNADNARWIYEHSNAFILFIDCEDLIERKNQAKTEIIDIAEMLKHNLKNRPVIAVWSKSDKKSDVNDIVKRSLEEELNSLFDNYSQIDISNFSIDDPDILVHKNNIKVIEWILEQVVKPSNIKLVSQKNLVDDTFLNYKRNE